MNQRVCICIPARNEAEHIPTLLLALGEQSGVAPFIVVLLVNNSDDGTAEIARAAGASAGGRYRLHVLEQEFAPSLAHAGSARRAAMDLGSTLLDHDLGLLISTDADCRPPENWVSANLAYAAADNIVGGRIELDENDEPGSIVLFSVRRRLDAYWHAVRAIEDEIDPCPWDPAPRHGDHTGASLALTVGLYHKAGGVPPLKSGEDRALVHAVTAVGGKLIHPPAVWTRASARTCGRADDGMASDMRAWLSAYQADEELKVPDFSHWVARARWRKHYRADQGNISLASAERCLSPMPCDMTLPEIDTP